MFPLATLLGAGKAKPQPLGKENLDLALSLPQAVWKQLSPLWPDTEPIPECFLDYKTAVISGTVPKGAIEEKARKLDLLDRPFVLEKERIKKDKVESKAAHSSPRKGKAPAPPGQSAKASTPRVPRTAAILLIAVDKIDIIAHLLRKGYEEGLLSVFPDFPGVKILLRGFGRNKPFWRVSNEVPVPDFERFASESRLGFIVMPQ